MPPLSPAQEPEPIVAVWLVARAWDCAPAVSKTPERKMATKFMATLSDLSREGSFCRLRAISGCDCAYLQTLIAKPGSQQKGESEVDVPLARGQRLPIAVIALIFIVDC